MQPGLTIERTHLDGLVVFLAVAELGGFRPAARRLGVTPSAVSQGVRALEERVGAPLFSRTTRSVSLTEAGERLLTHARPAVEMLTAGLNAASGLGGEISGRLRINAPRAALPLLANRLLPDFLALHPKVRLELVGEDRLVDIVEESFDAGIRFGHLVDADMVATRLTPPDRYVVVGTVAFLQKNGRPKRLEDLQQYPCITYRRPSGPAEPWRFVVAGETVAVSVEGRLITNDAETCIRSVLRGVGLFRVPRSLVMHFIEHGRMETVLDRYSVEIPGLSLYYPGRSQSLPKLRAFIDFARARMRRDYAAEDFVPTVSTTPLARAQHDEGSHPRGARCAYSRDE